MNQNLINIIKIIACCTTLGHNMVFGLFVIETDTIYQTLCSKFYIYLFCQPKYSLPIQMKAVTEMFKLFVNDREVMYDICALKIYGSFNVRVA